MKRIASMFLPVVVLTIWTLWLPAQAHAVETITEPQTTLTTKDTAITSLAFSPDGKTLALGSGDKTIRLLDASTAKEVASLKGHTEGVVRVAYSPDGKTLASGSPDKSIKLWDTATNKELATLTGHEIGVTIVTFSPDGKWLASVGLNLRESYRSEIKLWKLDGAETKLHVALPDGHRVRTIAFSPDSKTLAYGGSTINLWGIDDGKPLPSPKIHAFGTIDSLSYSPDGKTLAYGGGYVNRPCVIELWDLALDKARVDLSKNGWGLGSVAYSPDGKTLATWTESYDHAADIKLWDTADNNERATFHTAGPQALAFSPDSKRLAVVSSERTIDVWNFSKPE